MEPTAPPARRSRGEVRRQAVLDTAARLFLRHGYEKTTLDMVIAEAGGSRRTIYASFGNKQGLFGAVVGGRAQVMVAGLRSLEAVDQPPEATLTEFARLFLRQIISSGVIALLRLVIAEAPRFPELARAFYDSGPAVSRAELTAYFARLNERGRLRIADPAAAATQFLGIMFGNLHVRTLIFPDRPPPPEEIDAHVRGAVRTFLHGIGSARDREGGTPPDAGTESRSAPPTKRRPS